jgi:hypothetical protein
VAISLLHLSSALLNLPCFSVLFLSSVFFSHQEIEAKTGPGPNLSPSVIGGGGGGGRVGIPCTVILINITNVSVPVTLDNVHAICSPHGTVWRIITFTRGT